MGSGCPLVQRQSSVREPVWQKAAGPAQWWGAKGLPLALLALLIPLRLLSPVLGCGQTWSLTVLFNTARFPGCNRVFILEVWQGGWKMRKWGSKGLNQGLGGGNHVGSGALLWSSVPCPEAAAQQGVSHSWVWRIHTRAAATLSKGLTLTDPPPLCEQNPPANPLGGFSLLVRSGQGSASASTGSGRRAGTAGDCMGKVSCTAGSYARPGLGEWSHPRGQMLSALGQNGQVLYFWGSFWWGCSKISFQYEDSVILSGY